MEEPNQLNNVATTQRWSGIEGLRGFCILSVLTYHYWVKQLPGGFLGVSVFFTISGFVITNGLIRESEGARVDVAGFLLRRFRRLWPAAAMVLTLTLMYSLISGWASRTMASDGFASFFQYYNWRVITTGTVYGQDSPSIFIHFWSLSIEAQFYVLAPIIFYFSRGRKLIQISSFIAIFFVATFYATTSSSLTFIYSSTITRAAEISAGCLLAFATIPIKNCAKKPLMNHIVSTASILSFVILLALMLNTNIQSVAYAHGGLILVSFLSVSLIAGATFGRLAAIFFSIRPLVWLGKISYSLYLVHLPIRIILIWSGIWPKYQAWLSVVISIFLALLLFQFIEKPFRESRYSGTTKLVLATTLVLAFTVTQLWIRIDPPVNQKTFETLQSELQFLTQNAVHGAKNELPTVAIFGDSTALAIALGLSQVNSVFRFVGGYTQLGCPIGHGGLRRGTATTGDDPQETVWPVEPVCDWENWVTTTRSLGTVDIGVVLIGNWDLVGRRIDELGPDWLTIENPVYQSWLYNEMEMASDALHNAGVKRVMWLTLPSNVGYQPSQRLMIFNDLLLKLASTQEWISIADYASYIRTRDDLRPDGIHLSEKTSPIFAREWLAEQILQSQ